MVTGDDDGVSVKSSELDSDWLKKVPGVVLGDADGFSVTSSEADSD